MSWFATERRLATNSCRCPSTLRATSQRSLHGSRLWPKTTLTHDSPSGEHGGRTHRKETFPELGDHEAVSFLARKVNSYPAGQLLLGRCNANHPSIRQIHTTSRVGPVALRRGAGLLGWRGCRTSLGLFRRRSECHVGARLLYSALRLRAWLPESASSQSRLRLQP
jgi:hypothetical protein